MENETLDIELLQQILQELQTLNLNFANYSTYVSERNGRIDQEVALEKQTLQEQAEQALAESSLEEQATEDLTTQTLEKLDSLSTSVNSFHSDYTNNALESSIQVGALVESGESILYNTQYNTTCVLVLVGVLALFLGAYIGRVVFRKM